MSGNLEDKMSNIKHSNNKRTLIIIVIIIIMLDII
jgi:hypothetical protein